MISGTLGVQIGDKNYVVHANDSVSFESSQPHRLWAIGDESGRGGLDGRQPPRRPGRAARPLSRRPLTLAGRRDVIGVKRY